MDTSSITAIRAASVRLAISAHNVANVNTPGYHAMRAMIEEQPTQLGVTVRAEQTDQPVDLGREMVDQLMTLRYAQANMKVMKVQDQLSGTLLNMWA